MLTPSLLLVLASAGLLEARTVHDARHVHNFVHKRQADSTSLVANAIQSGSFVDGSTSIGANVANQVKSKTSKNNFINNCAGKVLTDGFQIIEGSCNGIPMGDIPSKANMVSSIITFPENGSADIQSDTTFNITVQVSNLVAGQFTNAVATYYGAPQTLQGGKIVGHTHVTVQDLGKTLNPTSPLDPTKFSFFKGINDAGNGNGLLQATVTGGLPAGNYRVCTLTSAANHQPVLMPVAQRGTSDDCSKFTIIGRGTVINDAANDGVKGIAAAALVQSAVQAGVGFQPPKSAATTSTSSSAVQTSQAAGNGGKGNGGKGDGGKGNGGKGNGGKGNGDKGKTTSVRASTTSSAVQTSKAAGNGGNKGGNGGNGNGGKGNGGKGNGGKGNGNGEKQVGNGATGKRIITVIETFFVFRKSRGGSCPSVKKNGNQFKVLEELFDDLASAAKAACGHQFTTCISFSGPGFSVEECASQKNDCAAVASTQRATATKAAVITASVTIPIDATASIPGSIIATQTITATSNAAAVTANPSKDGAQPPAQTSAAVADDAAASSVCSLVTSTITVDAPAAPTIISSKAAPFSNSTATASTPPAASSVTGGSTGAIGGIAAPAVIDSGDANRPFSVNGNTFVNKSAAVQRSCDIQFNLCANAVNGGKLSGTTLSNCSAQQKTCGSQ